jgi:hypothetical protein
MFVIVHSAYYMGVRRRWIVLNEMFTLNKHGEKLSPDMSEVILNLIPKKTAE